MSYKPRDERPGVHHVVTRGNNKRRVFLNNADRELFLVMLVQTARRYGWTIYAYCLMGNHYHLVMQIDERGLSRGMCELNGMYAIEFNARHGRINHLFGKRFWNEYLPDDRRVLNTVRYVVQNPRRAGLVESLEKYAWSSYAATIGLALAFAQLATGEVLGFFGNKRDRAVRRFVEFCDDAGSAGRVPRQPP